MYVGDPAASQDPPEQLAGFQRVTLNPGQSATVSFPLTIHDLASWSAGRQRLGGSGRHLLDLGRRLLGQPAADRLDQPGPRADRPGRRGHLGRGRLAGQHGGQRERHPELGRAGRGDRRRGQPATATAAPRAPAVSFTMQALDSNSSAGLTFTRHRAAARHHHRLERDDLRFRHHARDLHRDRDRDRHGRSLRHGHLRVVRRAVTHASPQLRADEDAGTTAGLRFRAAVVGGLWLRAVCSRE